jgi:hypothetical protein
MLLEIHLCTGTTEQTIFFGAEAFSTANLLDQKILTITDNFQINTGISKITLGTHNEFSQSKNVFFLVIILVHYNTLDDFLIG